MNPKGYKANYNVSDFKRFQLSHLSQVDETDEQALEFIETELLSMTFAQYFPEAAMVIEKVK